MIFSLFLFPFILTNSLKSVFYDENYNMKSAKEKRDILWQSIKEDDSETEWTTPFEMNGLLLIPLKPTFENKLDILINKRYKYGHSVGVVGKFKILIDKDKYSGIFKGCENAIGRFSLGTKPDITKISPDGALNNFTPGFALKCLRDNIPSANLIVMNDFAGQNSWNYFKYDLSNHVPSDNVSTQVKTILDRFYLYTDYVGILGTKDLSQYDEKGIEQKFIKNPYKIVLKPNQTLKEKFSDFYEIDWIDQIKSINPGETIYSLFVQEYKNSDLEYIGKINLVEENIVNSKFGDKYLFFRHSKWESDI